MGILFNKPMAEWKDIFNAAAQQLNIPLTIVDPLRGTAPQDIEAHLANITDGFDKAQDKPAIVLVDSWGNKLAVADADSYDRLCTELESLTETFPKAVYVQAVPEDERHSSQSVNFYCMNPSVPRASGRIDPA